MTLQQNKTHHPLTLRRRYVDRFYYENVKNITGKVLDLGGNRCNKRGSFDISQYTVEVVYANLSSQKSPDVQCDALHLPFKQGCFDTVVCAEVLEHIYHVPSVIKEIQRVLHPGGQVLMTVPFLYRLHGDPEDYGRYTEHYWRRCLQDHGFEQIHIENHGGFCGVLADFMIQYRNEVGFKRPWQRVGYGLIGRLIRWLENKDSLKLSQNQAFHQSFTTGFGIIARKSIES